MAFVDLPQPRIFELYYDPFEDMDRPLYDPQQFFYRPSPTSKDRAYPHLTFAQHNNWTTPPYPDAIPLHLKHTDSGLTELSRVDSGWSTTTHLYDGASSTRNGSLYDDRYSPPCEHEIPGMSPDTNCEHTQVLDHFAGTISMGDVQHFADSPSEYTALDMDLTAYQPCCPQEGYLPIQDGSVEQEGYSSMHDDRVDVSVVSYNDAVHLPAQPHQTLPINPPESPVLRQRRPVARSNTNKSQATRVSKRPSRRSTAISPPASEIDMDPVIRPFLCPLAPYGCTSTFGSKNEWKRHLSTQHLRLEYWRCDQCPVTHGKKPNDFNRRDLFTQHVRRMHIEIPTAAARKNRGKPVKSEVLERQVQDAAARCNVKLRDPPQKSICVVCRKSFSGRGSWDERMEHIGKHFESAKKQGAEAGESTVDVDSWCADTDVEVWMMSQGILTPQRELAMPNDESRE